MTAPGMGAYMVVGWRGAAKGQMKRLIPWSSASSEATPLLLWCVVENAFWNNDSVMKKEIENDWTRWLLGLLTDATVLRNPPLGDDRGKCHSDRISTADTWPTRMLPLHCVVIYAATLNACEVVDSCEVLGKHRWVTESAIKVLPV